MSKRKLEFDEIGYWSELKLEILEKYQHAYSTILTTKKFHHYYIDGFAGPGKQLSKASGDWVPGSPLRALSTVPPFERHFFIDLNGGRLQRLKEQIGDRSDVKCFEGDCNSVLLNEILPEVRYDLFRRALCLLDPYGLHLEWPVMQKAGALKTVDMFLNFPIMDINRRALWSQRERVDPESAAALSRFWGDDSWQSIAYQASPQGSLFGEPNLEKVSNEVVVEAFRQRLKSVAGFAEVPEPLPMRNSTNAVVYYLFFASQQPLARRIVDDIFRPYRDRNPGKS